MGTSGDGGGDSRRTLWGETPHPVHTQREQNCQFYVKCSEQEKEHTHTRVAVEFKSSCVSSRNGWGHLSPNKSLKERAPAKAPSNLSTLKPPPPPPPPRPGVCQQLSAAPDTSERWRQINQHAMLRGRSSDAWILRAKRF